MLGIIVFHVKAKLDRLRELNQHFNIQCEQTYPFEKVSGF